MKDLREDQVPKVTPEPKKDVDKRATKKVVDDVEDVAPTPPMMPMKPSVELKKEPDTQPHPAMRLAEYLIEEMKLEGSSNDLDHTSNVSHGETNFLGDGVPGYESGELNGPDNDTEEEEESRLSTAPKPSPFGDR